MSRNVSELGTLLVNDTCDESTSLLFRILLLHGRLPFPALQHHTGLSSRLVRQGLQCLIQHMLVFCYTPDNGLTTYEANSDAAYSLVRSNKYVEITRNRVGELAGGIISTLLAQGLARVGALLQAREFGEGKDTQKPLTSLGSSAKSLPNESKQTTMASDGKIGTLESVHASLRELLRLGLVSRVHPSHFRSDADNRSEAEKIVPPVEDYKAKTRRDREAQWELAVAQNLKDWKYGVEGKLPEVNGNVNGKKRPREDAEDPNPQKRQRLTSSTLQANRGQSGSTDKNSNLEDGLVDNNTVVRVDNAKFTVLMRNDYLVRFAEQSICASTSEVYAKVLHALEPKTRFCKEDDSAIYSFSGEHDLSDLPQISTEELVPMFDGSTELASALGNVQASMVDLTQVNHPKKRRKKEPVNEDEAIVDGDASSDEDENGDDSDDNDSAIISDSDDLDGDADYHQGPFASINKDPHREAIRDHLLLLARHPHRFLHHFPQTHLVPERWTVDFPPLIANVIHHKLLETITTRYGASARRIASILHEQGKVGEKDLTWISLMPQKPMRSSISKLHNGGMIHLQEVPRDSSRTPARTMYLWYFDTERSKAKLLEETYKVIARHVQRARVEGEKVRSTVEKANRSDVIGKEEEFLTIHEREALEKWKEVEGKMSAEVERLDDLVGLMRDY